VLQLTTALQDQHALGQRLTLSASAHPGPREAGLQASNAA